MRVMCWPIATAVPLLLATSLAAQPPASAPATAPGAPAAPGLVAEVDPRVELLCIIFRLAGNPEYNLPNSQSPYSAEVAAHFEPHRDHEVIRRARALRARRGVSYDAVMTLAVHITPPPALAEKMPFEPRPARLDARWEPEEARAFLVQVREFARAADFAGFWEAHHELYRAAGRRMTARLAERDYLGWFDRFFGARPGARFRVYVGLLNGGSCYGVSLRHADGREEITPVLGVWKFEPGGLPVIEAGIVPTVVHELCHAYTNPLVDRHAERLDAAGQRLFAAAEAAMRRQAYGNGRTVLYESLVRACVVRYLRAVDGAAAAEAELRRQDERGFRWVRGLAELLGEYEGDRAAWPTLDAFMPRIAAYLDEFAADSAPDLPGRR